MLSANGPFERISVVASRKTWVQLRGQFGLRRVRRSRQSNGICQSTDRHYRIDIKQLAGFFASSGHGFAAAAKSPLSAGLRTRRSGPARDQRPARASRGDDGMIEPAAGEPETGSDVVGFEVGEFLQNLLR